MELLNVQECSHFVILPLLFNSLNDIHLEVRVVEYPQLDFGEHHYAKESDRDATAGELGQADALEEDGNECRFPPLSIFVAHSPLLALVSSNIVYFSTLELCQVLAGKEWHLVAQIS
jgi:hypothetical protein